MANHSQRWLLLVPILLALSITCAHAISKSASKMKSAVFLSPKFVLGPGSVENKFYYNIDFPKGHIALKSFNAEVVDEAGNPVSLQETYLHHWVVARYYAPKDDKEVLNYNGNQKLQRPGYISGRNSGICQKGLLGQYFGLGSETRKTATHIPDPYGIEVGNPAEIPDGYEERWMINVHAIDTRGAEDKLGCTECRCELYNVTVSEFGRPLKPGYKGGLECCYDGTQCRLKQGFVGARRSLYLRYTVKWVDWNSFIVPVKIYIFDVTDTWKKSDGSSGLKMEHDCKVEYEVESCSSTGMVGDACVHSKRISLVMPFGGYVIYGVAHQHSGGIGSTLYREDGQVICSSIPAYGKGDEPGNEAGYIVGMSTCFPQPGSIKITNDETLILESNYSSTIDHTGVMGLFYLLVAEQLPKPVHSFYSLVQMQDNMKFSSSLWLGVALLGVAVIAIAIGMQYRHQNKEQGGYQSLVL